MNSIDARGRPHGPPAPPTPGWQLDLGDGGSTGAITLVDPPGAGIHSAGVDLVDVARIRRAVLRSGEPFVRRVFGERERAAVSRDPDRRISELAALFGVKESVVKAMGGMPLGGSYADICVDLPGRDSARTVLLTGQLAHWARQHQVDVLAGSAPAGGGMLLSWALALARDARATGTRAASTRSTSTSTRGTGAQARRSQTTASETSGGQTTGGLVGEARSGQVASGSAGAGQPRPGPRETGPPETGEVAP